MTFIYDVIAYLFRPGDNAFALIAHASVSMTAKELRLAGDYLIALAENREARQA